MIFHYAPNLNDGDEDLIVDVLQRFRTTLSKEGGMDKADVRKLLTFVEKYLSTQSTVFSVTVKSAAGFPTALMRGFDEFTADSLIAPDLISGAFPSMPVKALALYGKLYRQLEEVYRSRIRKDAIYYQKVLRKFPFDAKGIDSAKLGKGE